MLPEPTTIQFPATILSNTEQRACFNVAIIDDGIVEATEAFTLQLSTNDPQALLTSQSAVPVSITDNDGKNKIAKLYHNNL